MDDINRRAARVTLTALVAALVLALVIAVAITTGAFVLSFEAQRSLAVQALLPRGLAWIYPAIVDSAITGATIAVVALSKLDGSAKGRQFFLTLDIVVVGISVAGNAYHAALSSQAAADQIRAGAHLGIDPLAPAVAALIAIIPPMLVLAFTHGVGILVRAIGGAITDYRNAVASTGATQLASAQHSNAGTDAEATATDSVATLLTSNVAADTQHDANVADTFDKSETASRSADAPVATHSAGRNAHDRNDDAAVAPLRSDVVPVTPSRNEVAAVRQRRNVLPAPIAGRDMAGPVQTVESLLAFIERSDLPEQVKETARLKITRPELTFAVLGEITGGVQASTAYRRYKRAEERALAAGFTVPPLPDLAGELELDDASRAREGELVASR